MSVNPEASMPVKWKTLLTKLTFWLMIEILLTLLGIDNLADYSEFIFGRRSVLAAVFTKS